MIAWLLAVILLLAGPAMAERVTLHYSADSNISGPQFEVSSRVWNNPRIVFALYENSGNLTNLFNASGSTIRLKWAQTVNESSMYSITASSTTNGSCEFLVNSNEFGRSCSKWYCVLVITDTNGNTSTFAEGLMTLGLSPEITGGGVISRLSLFDGAQYEYRNISNEGPVRFEAAFPVTTNADGSITVGPPSVGVAAFSALTGQPDDNTALSNKFLAFASTNDARLFDARTPLAHTQAVTTITGLGNASLSNAADFATAAQGSRADLAVLSTNDSPSFGAASSMKQSLAVGSACIAGTHSLSVGASCFIGNNSVAIGDTISAYGDEIIAFGKGIYAFPGEFVWNPSWMPTYFGTHGPGSISFLGATNGMYLGEGGKYYGDGSALTGLVATNDARYLASLTNNQSGVTLYGPDATVSNQFVNLGQALALQGSAQTYNFWAGSNSPIVAGAKTLLPISAGTPPIATNSVAIASNGQYIVACTPPAGLTSLKAGAYTVTRNMWKTGAGGASVDLAAEIYIRSTNGTEVEVTAVSGTAPQSISSSVLEYIFALTVSSNYAMNVTDSIEVKMKTSGLSGAPTVNLNGGTLQVPIPSGQFVLQSQFNAAGLAAAGAITNSLSDPYMTPTNLLGLISGTTCTWTRAWGNAGYLTPTGTVYFAADATMTDTNGVVGFNLDLFYNGQTFGFVGASVTNTATLTSNAWNSIIFWKGRGSSVFVGK